MHPLQVHEAKMNFLQSLMTFVSTAYSALVEYGGQFTELTSQNEIVLSNTAVVMLAIGLIGIVVEGFRFLTLRRFVALNLLGGGLLMGLASTIN